MLVWGESGALDFGAGIMGVVDIIFTSTPFLPQGKGPSHMQAQAQQSNYQIKFPSTTNRASSAGGHAASQTTKVRPSTDPDWRRPPSPSCVLDARWNGVGSQDGMATAVQYDRADIRVRETPHQAGLTVGTWRWVAAGPGHMLLSHVNSNRLRVAGINKCQTISAYRMTGNGALKFPAQASACFTVPFQPLEGHATPFERYGAGLRGAKTARDDRFAPWARPSFSRRWLPDMNGAVPGWGRFLTGLC
ncbi:hypothetical protein BO78DRAFT_424031 [Aspergillus sclerotiicarbonarius CBS 121057]|uniref:Uncharacterized protein n=1 Tax=Aspergillus sclerotiicarbonarius (strain CBS 121057 / IBT 28362) TaxID=1448318 RepID=A0A319EB62_ASPSB|nr:hypothetical protein BO78DRAFT_424031 [Aspergillus sclerotiicarbonarius CBS 121057]